MLEGLESPLGLVVDPKIEGQKRDEPTAVVALGDADMLAGKDAAEEGSMVAKDPDVATGFDSEDICNRAR